MPAQSGAVLPDVIGLHRARYDDRGVLQPWAPWIEVLDREMNWYLRCPLANGYPRFVTMTFMDPHYQAIEKRRDFIPAMQNGMGIISYLRYYQYKGRTNPRVLQFARLMGNYLIDEALTPDSGSYPRFPRSTGMRDRFPQPPESGSQADRPFEIQPDKGGIVAYALGLLYDETQDSRYRDAALQIARVLVRNIQKGDATKSPWPFRADYRTGEARGPVSGNMTYILRCFDWMIAHGYPEFAAAREELWHWIGTYQIPSARRSGTGQLWAQFFEDHDELDNRTAWAPLNLARYLIERKDALDTDWRADSATLIEFVNRNFTSVYRGIAVCGEQDHDPAPWSGILSTWGAVLAMYASATGSAEYRLLARQAVNLLLYEVSEDGCPADSPSKAVCGGWQEDAHTDKVHNLLDAITAFPDWAK
jgi:hypothetical protein